MNTDKQQTDKDSVEKNVRPIVFHIEGQRQWYGERELTKEQLVRLAGVSQRQIAEYEGMVELPKGVRSLLLIALALRKPIEELIAPDVIADEAVRIEARREQLKLDDEQPLDLPYAT
jgi:transcriptional regulator with XRE-family HTH domain